MQLKLSIHNQMLFADSWNNDTIGAATQLSEQLGVWVEV
jgi:hypothetical protein